jgi:hypothetical protein
MFGLLVEIVFVISIIFILANAVTVFVTSKTLIRAFELTFFKISVFFTLAFADTVCSPPKRFMRAFAPKVVSMVVLILERACTVVKKCRKILALAEISFSNSFLILALAVMVFVFSKTFILDLAAIVTNSPAVLMRALV